MAWWMLENRQAVADHIGCAEPDMQYLFTFANTGMEHDDTLRFLDAVDRELLGGKVVWLEGVAQHGQKKSTQHRVVDYATAYRNSQWRDPRHPFHDNIIKYGIPCPGYIHCTREMKLNTINSYVEYATGLKRNSGYHTAIGIREDEKRRVSAAAGVNHIIYPLTDLHPVDKQDVLDWFVQFDWDLAIPEWQGNCVTCYKKSFKKLAAVWHESPGVFDFTDAMEQAHAFVGPEFEKHGATRPRTFFRGNRSTQDMIALFDATPSVQNDYINTMQDAGCSESCEMYPMEGEA